MGTTTSVESSIVDWVIVNLPSLLIILIGTAITLVASRLIIRYINRLRKEKRIGQNLTYILIRTTKGISVFVVIVIVVSQLNLDLSWAAAILAAAGGTIIGFASINTLGNAIAGIIIMTSQPFRIGDRLFAKGEFADVVAVELIYTRLKTLDNILISVPNQELLKSPIPNFGKHTTVRRHCSITVGYEENREKVKRVLLEAAGKIEGVLEDPKPFVWLTKMSDFGAVYTLYVFTKQIKRIDRFDADMNELVFDFCSKNGIDLRTPQLRKNI